jgi:hypothetical protein
MAGNKRSDKRDKADWAPCPKGTLSALSGKLKGRSRRRRFLKAAGVLSLAVVGGGAAAGLGLFFWKKPNDGMQDFNFGGISCAEVRQQAQAFAMGQVQEPLLGRIRAHVALCPRCGALIRNMQKKAEG